MGLAWLLLKTSASQLSDFPQYLGPFCQIFQLAQSHLDQRQIFVFISRWFSATAADLMPVRSSTSAGAVVAITIAIFLMILIIVDISCYFLNGCGFTMFVCVHLCEKIPSKNKQMNQETDNKWVRMFVLLIFFFYYTALDWAWSFIARIQI